jgi:large subunit ribosomal protein L29
MSKAADLREADESELETRLAEAKQELFNLRFQMVTGQQDNSAMLRTTRREIARILTVLREKEIEAAEALEPAARGGEGA